MKQMEGKALWGFLSLVGLFSLGDPAAAQGVPAPIHMPGYDRYWASQSPQQRLNHTRNLETDLPPPPPQPTGLDAFPLLTATSAQDLLPEPPWVKPLGDPLEVLAPVLLAQAGDVPVLPAAQPSVWERFPLLEPFADPPPPPAVDVFSRFPVLTPLPDSPPPPVMRLATNPGLSPELAERFPLLAPPPPPQGSRVRQELSATVVTQLPLDPNQINIQGDILKFDAEEQLGIAEGNAIAQFADGTTISGNRLLYDRADQRLRAEGPFILRQPLGRGSQQQRQVQGRDLDFDIPTRSAQFFNSLVVFPGEAPGTLVYVRSQETTALIDNQLFFENATVTTSPEPPITHYIQGDRVEVYANDQVVIHSARVFAGGQQDPVTGDLGGGTQIAYFPLFIYSLRDHQWVLPGYSEAEGIFVKSSWAYRFNEYNFGGLRLDAIQKKGIGLGFVHDYILPIPNSVNYGRAQAYIVTEADQNRLSSRFRLDHFYDFYNVNLLGTEGTLKGNLILNFDNTYRPSGGRNDNADFQLSSTFTAPYSTTSLNLSRTASASLGTYRFPITLSHNQRFADIPWLRANLRLDYANQQNTVGGRDSSTARLEANLQATPPDLGSFNLTYRTFSSSNGDTDSSRRNLEFSYIPPVWRLSPTLTLSTNLGYSQNQQRDSTSGAQRFFDRYDLRASLRFSDIPLAPWATLIPGSIDYAQVLYSTGDQESTVSLHPRLLIKPNNWSNLELRYSRIFQGNNSTPFQAIPVLTRDTHRFNANLSFFTPQGSLPNVPPGFIAFEDDLPGEAPIAIIFEDDTDEDRAELEAQRLALAQETIQTLWRFDSTTGFDWITNRWDLVTANFTWNTTPNLYAIQLSTSYDPNLGQFNPINLRWSGRSSTTFERDLRSGLPRYEPGFSYGIQMSYDPKRGQIKPYSLDFDATIGTTWENHWRFRIGIGDDGIRLLEIRRDLRDFEVRLAYDPRAEIFRLEGILVAFPSRPVGLVQQRGDFSLSTPIGSLGSDSLLP
ncbi:MAG: hypothetical protein Q6L49_10835 [Thermostichales cyanobacterium HHBFW_bins_127]